MSGVNSLGRKVWDKEFYSKSKEERDQIRGLDSESKSEGGTGDGPIEDPQKKRELYLNVSKNVGVLKTYSGSGDVREDISGYWCELCKLSFNDSHSWIRHLNSQSHNQKMGTSLYVEKRSLESVKRRLSELIHDYDNEQGIFSKDNGGKRGFGASERFDNSGKAKTQETNGEDGAQEDNEARSQLLMYDFPANFV
ncbi:U1-like C2H2 zinc finger [Cryptosporidium canis]|nr:U1-like C2H2 zinc finger [Cryptosporidium canis]